MDAVLMHLSTPIRLLDSRDIGFDLSELNGLKKPFENLPVDDYLQKQNIFEYLESLHVIRDQDKIIFADFYSRHITDTVFYDYVNAQFGEQAVIAIRQIKPTRFRYCSTYLVNKIGDGLVACKRSIDDEFYQAEAKTINQYDWRKLPRRFVELPEEFATDELYTLMQWVSNIIFQSHPLLACMRLTVHHTKIISTSTQSASNSPEGVHQDGMDYIMSAFVVMKDNASGGVSYIYGADAKTPIMVSTLHEGQGILQPDKNSDLWHSVTSIVPVDASKPAIRATIGFDFEFVG